jgi:hypothetical protein
MHQRKFHNLSDEGSRLSFQNETMNMSNMCNALLTDLQTFINLIFYPSAVVMLVG